MRDKTFFLILRIPIKTKEKTKREWGMTREEDGNDNRPEMSFYFSTDHEPDDERRNKREETFGEEKVKGNYKSDEEEGKILEEKVKETTLSCLLWS